MHAAAILMTSFEKEVIQSREETSLLQLLFDDFRRFKIQVTQKRRQIMKTRFGITVVVVLALSMLLGACAPAATPTAGSHPGR